MKKLVILSATLLLACGSSSPKQVERPAEELMLDPTPAATPSELRAEAPPPAPMPEPEPAPPPPPMAVANLVSIKDGSAIGKITFELDGSDIKMDGSFAGLKPGPHAFYIHEVGDCSNKGKKVGKHLDPTKAKHGPPASSTRHAGDLGDIVADADGNAAFQMTTNSVVLEAGRPDSIVQRAIVIHGKKDDRKGVSAPFACGVIEMSDADQQQAAQQ